MTPEELKEMVRQLIGKNRINEAIDEIINWARDNHRAQLKNDISLLKGKSASLDREKRLGFLSDSEASAKHSRIAYGVLTLLDSESSPIPGKPSTEPLSRKTKILMLTANPADTTRLNLDKEHSVITQKLQQKQEHFNIILRKAVSGTEFKEFAQQEQPDILHFSGHNVAGQDAGIVVQNDDKNEKALISVSGLKSLFKFLKKRFNIKVVLLNACHTQEQAAVIAAYVDYVIGTSVAIGDDAASAFSSGFYFQLAEDNEMNIEDAFDSGRTEAVMKGAAEENFVIYQHGKLIEVS